MPKKLSSAVVGTLAVGLTMPLTANAAAADTAPLNAMPVPATGVDAPAMNASGLSTVDISATRNATQFRFPLAQRSYSYTSPYGPRCMPAPGASTWHLGQDLGAADGSPIYSVAEGTVVRTFNGNRYNAGYVVIQHRVDGKTFHSAYYHMWDANSHVRVGQSVQAGQTIARIGNSGPSTGPHLHLEIWEGAWINGTSHDPTTWLAQRGVNLRSGATTVLNISTPSSCDYYTSTSTALRSTASSSGAVITQLGAGTALTAAPGAISNSMLRVTANGRTGWVAHSAVTPNRPAGTVPASSAPQGTSITPTKYRTTASLNARSGPGTNYAVQQGLASGTEVTVIATHGSWLKFSRNGQTVWSHSDFMTKVATTPTTPTTAASGTYKVQAGVSLRARSGPGTSNSIVKVLDPGTTVSVTGKNGDWFSYRDGSRTLWLQGSFLEQVTTTPTTPTTAASGTYKVQAGVSLRARSGPGTSNSIVKVLNPGTTVSVTGKNGEWFSYRDGSRTLWLQATWLDQVTTPTTAASGTYKVQSGVSLRARSGPGTSNSIVKVLNPGTTVSVTGKNGEWFSYRDGSRTLWLQATWLDQVSASSGSSSSGSSSNTGSTTAASGTYKVQAGVSLRARSGPGTSNSIVKVLNPGTTVSVTGKNGEWFSYRDGSRTLWLQATWLDQVTTPTTAASGTYKVQAGVSLRARSGPGTSNSIVKVLNPGTTVSVTGKNGEWFSYRDGSRTLWLQATWLDRVTTSTGSGSGTETIPGGPESSSSTPTTSSGQYTVKSGVNLNARTGASTSSSSAKVLAPGTRISITGEQNEWVSFKDGSRTLWVHSGYLDQTTATQDAERTSAASGAYRVKNSVSLRARSGASTSSSIVKVLNPGTTVEITGKNGAWFSYRDGSQTLWVQASFLDQVTGSTGSDSSSNTGSNAGSNTGSSSTSAASGTFQVKSGVNLNARTGASATSSSAKVLAPGTKISITGKQGDWVSYKDGSRTLWVHSGYLAQASGSSSNGSGSGSSSNTGSNSGSSSNAGSNSGSSSGSSSGSTGSTTSASGKYHVKNDVYLNARSGPATSHPIVLNLNPKREFEITGRSGNWVSFVYSGKTVWVDSTYINSGPASSSGSSSSGSSNSGSSSSTPTLANSTNSKSKVVGTAYATAQVNVRMGPSTQNSAMFSVRTGTKVELLEKKSSGWQEIKVNGATGWMSAQYLSTSAPATSGSNNSGSNSGSSGSGSSTAPSTASMHKKSANGPYSSAWDRLAQCESGGNWKINTGNGFYGGIQFSPESWKEVGGSGFPHQASKEEQIKRAYMLWKKQGWKAWPHCTSQLGLKGDPGGYGDAYYKVHPSAKTASSVSSAGTWTSSHSVPLRENASTSSDKLVQIPRGAQLEQLQREGSWLKVRYTQGGDTHTGWVNTSYILQA